MIAGLTKMRATAGSRAAALISAVCSGVQTSPDRYQEGPAAPYRWRKVPRAPIGVNRRLWHRRQPHICVEPDLMRGVAGDHRTAARLGDVADEQTGPAIDLGQALPTASAAAGSDWDVPSCDCATAASPARSPRRWGSPSRRRRSPAHSCQWTGRGVGPAWCCGRIAPWRPAPGLAGSPAAGGALGQQTPCPVPKPARRASTDRRRRRIESSSSDQVIAPRAEREPAPADLTGCCAGKGFRGYAACSFRNRCFVRGV